jgi:hypothetical protein
MGLGFVTHKLKLSGAQEVSGVLRPMGRLSWLQSPATLALITPEHLLTLSRAGSAEGL